MFEQLQETFANYGIDLWLKKDDNIEAKVPSKANTQLWADYLLTKIIPKNLIIKLFLMESFQIQNQ